MAVLRIDDLVQTGQRFIEADDVVEDLFINLVRVFELAEINTLCRTYNLDFGGTVIVSIKSFGA